MDDKTSRSITLIFDGECPFCGECAEWFRNHLRPGAEVDVIPFQQLAPAGVGGVSREQLASAAWWFDADGRAYRGPLAVARALKECRGLWPAAGSLVAAWPIRFFSEGLYNFVAVHRGRLAGRIPGIRPRPRRQ